MVGTTAQRDLRRFASRASRNSALRLQGMTQGPILIAGCNGQVARCLQELAAMRSVAAVAFGREQLDLEMHSGVDSVVATVAPSAIINAAQAESQEASAFSINRDGARALAAASARMNIPF